MINSVKMYCTESVGDTTTVVPPVGTSSPRLQQYQQPSYQLQHSGRSHISTNISGTDIKRLNSGENSTSQCDNNNILGTDDKPSSTKRFTYRPLLPRPAACQWGLLTLYPSAALAGSHNLPESPANSLPSSVLTPLMTANTVVTLSGSTSLSSYGAILAHNVLPAGPVIHSRLSTGDNGSSPHSCRSIYASSLQASRCVVASTVQGPAPIIASSLHASRCGVASTIQSPAPIIASSLQASRCGIASTVQSPAPIIASSLQASRCGVANTVQSPAPIIASSLQASRCGVASTVQSPAPVIASSLLSAFMTTSNIINRIQLSGSGALISGNLTSGLATRNSNILHLSCPTATSSLQSGPITTSRQTSSSVGSATNVQSSTSPNVRNFEKSLLRQTSLAFSSDTLGLSCDTYKHVDEAYPQVTSCTTVRNQLHSNTMGGTGNTGTIAAGRHAAEQICVEGLTALSEAVSQNLGGDTTHLQTKSPIDAMLTQTELPSAATAMTFRPINSTNSKNLKRSADDQDSSICDIEFKKEKPSMTKSPLYSMSDSQEVSESKCTQRGHPMDGHRREQTITNITEGDNREHVMETSAIHTENEQHVLEALSKQEYTGEHAIEEVSLGLSKENTGDKICGSVHVDDCDSEVEDTLFTAFPLLYSSSYLHEYPESRCPLTNEREESSECSVKQLEEHSEPAVLPPRTVSQPIAVPPGCSSHANKVMFCGEFSSSSGDYPSSLGDMSSPPNCDPSYLEYRDTVECVSTSNQSEDSSDGRGTPPISRKQRKPGTPSKSPKLNDPGFKGVTLQMRTELNSDTSQLFIKAFFR